MFPVSDVIPSRTRPAVTIALVALSALVFLGGLRLGADPYGVASTVMAPGAPAWAAMLAVPFLHFGWMDLVANLLCLWIFGDHIENGLGRAPYMVFYLGASMLGLLAHAAASPGSVPPLVGASAPVAAIIAAYFVLYPRSQILVVAFLVVTLDVIEVPAIFLVGSWVLVQSLAAVARLGTIGAPLVLLPPHLVGLAAGVLAGLALRRRIRWDGQTTQR